MAHRVRLAAVLARVAQDAIAEVEGGRLVRAALQARTPGPQVVWAVGKAAGAMTHGAMSVLGDQLSSALVIDKAPLEPLGERVRTMVAAHPLPDFSSVAAGRALHAEASRLGTADRALLLLSGGASSLSSAPLDGVPLAVLIDATRGLQRGGATIQEINTVRRHLGLVLGGRLAAATRGFIDVLALSDVVGDDPAAIGSGPASPDPSTLADALALARRYALPAPVLDALAAAPETPKPGDPLFARVCYRILANPHTLVAAAQSALARAGLLARRRGELVQGPLEAFADELVAQARTLAPGEVLLAAGEPTVEVRGDGLGGRAQHLALRMAERLAGGEVAFVGCGSDGSDGPTPAAGAAVDGTTWETARARGCDPAAALARYDAHPLLTTVGATLVTGPTGTNLTDLFLLGRAA